MPSPKRRRPQALPDDEDSHPDSFPLHDASENVRKKKYLVKSSYTPHNLSVVAKDVGDDNEHQASGDVEAALDAMSDEEIVERFDVWNNTMEAVLSEELKVAATNMDLARRPKYHIRPEISSKIAASIERSSSSKRRTGHMMETLHGRVWSTFAGKTSVSADTRPRNTVGKPMQAASSELTFATQLKGQPSIDDMRVARLRRFDSPDKASASAPSFPVPDVSVAPKRPKSSRALGRFPMLRPSMLKGLRESEEAKGASLAKEGVAKPIERDGSPVPQPRQKRPANEERPAVSADSEGSSILLPRKNRKVFVDRVIREPDEATNATQREWECD